MMGMTVAERDYYNDIRQINKKMKDQSKTDWEVRRYEMVKDMVIQIVNSPDDHIKARFYEHSDEVIQDAIDVANEIIDALILENLKHPL